ncbi:histidine phosphotransferase family protein [Oceaniovalibus guishaninsula]|uniref:histidine phosphotransferase family protein n=1 Tax=Oceaniovalibus guishaninsula TaxID=1046117 RepID=UPI00058D8C00|nr:histidine phosphotransferase family protein [Oceaniovalibus guishaninsula]
MTGRVEGDLAPLVSSRICHDLVSPLGAIANGVELMQMSGAQATPELALIAESVENANARIRLFRVAFGAVQPGQTIARSEAVSILRGIGKGRGLQVDWRPETDLARDEARLAFLLLLCCETAMPWGGTVAADLTAGRWRLEGRATRMRMDGDCWTALTGRPDGLPAPAEVHFALARDAADRLARPIGVQRQADALILTA